ncbi:hypothetical protein EJ377_09500 [Chryseobacterium arthrosphaerae]|uniref:Uncharacterized protein n=1 Tax=Chryseobacterium arthrosphaerae TaxID=651561 RepID=A0A432E1H4_9FLAO|nr:hypothetical protein EJ377_09500 [Chryseobacterium arthrosphaerae]
MFTGFQINNYTYVKTNTVSGPHAIGFIWATMLWILHGNILKIWL